MSMGIRFKNEVNNNEILQIFGVINSYSAIQAKIAGVKAIYLSGAGVANASIGVPDLGITNLNDVLVDVKRITAVSDLPLLVDIDTGFGGIFNIQRTIKELIWANAAGIHIEDQISQKRCGHRPNKEIVSINEMQERIYSCVDAKNEVDSNFVIMARTDSKKNEGIESAIKRAEAYVKAGADMIFAEALNELDEYKLFVSSLNVPVLANITEFGETPYYNIEELKKAGVKMALYPLSAFRAMNKAALTVFKSILENGDQKNVLDIMQTRKELYKNLDYYSFEQKIDHLNKKGF